MKKEIDKKIKEKALKIFTAIAGMNHCQHHPFVLCEICDKRLDQIINGKK